MFEIGSGELRATFLGNHTGDASCTRRPTQQHKGHHAPNEALHPLRAAAPVTGRDTRSEGVHCLRIGCAPNHKNKRGICETPTRRQHAGGQLLMLQTPTAQFKTVAQGANLDGPNGERTGRPGRGCRDCSETGK